MESLASILTVMLEKELISSQDVVALLQRTERATNTGQVSRSTLARLEAALKLEELSETEPSPAGKVSKALTG